MLNQSLDDCSKDSIMQIIVCVMIGRPYIRHQLLAVSVLIASGAKPSCSYGFVCFVFVLCDGCTDGPTGLFIGHEDHGAVSPMFCINLFEVNPQLKGTADA